MIQNNSASTFCESLVKSYHATHFPSQTILCQFVNFQNMKQKSQEINQTNIVSRLEECASYISAQEWHDFFRVYDQIDNYNETRNKSRISVPEDEISIIWQSLRSHAVDALLSNIEHVSTFDDFIDWVEKIAKILKDPRMLWNIMHNEMHTTLKINEQQVQQINEKFFSPEMVFEFGIDSFISCFLCDFSEIKSEEDIIDIFYAIAGFYDFCRLPKAYEVMSNHFVDYIGRLLLHFTSLPDFNAYKFAWLIEEINKNFHIPEYKIYQTMELIIRDLACRENERNLEMLHKMCIISTSPFMNKLPMLKEIINFLFKSASILQHDFTHRYIFGSIVNGTWDGEKETNKVSDTVQAWKLYIESFNNKLKKKKELPYALLIDILNDSLTQFSGFYGEIQPSKARAKDMRRDIFVIIDTIGQFYKNPMDIDPLNKVWFLLCVAAITGATKEQLNNIIPKDTESNDLFLGLKHSENEFKDYDQALSVFSKKFESQSDAIPKMIEYMRKNIHD